MPLDETGRSTRRGMPSARGLEWRKEPGDGANLRFAENFDRIPRNPDGSMVWESDYVPDSQEELLPESCEVCQKENLFWCPNHVVRGSEICRKHLGV